MKKVIGLLSVVVILGIVGFVLWAVVFPPDYSVPPTIAQQGLGASICFGVPIAILLAVSLIWLDNG